MAFENVIGNLIRNQGLSVPKVLQATAGNVVCKFYVPVFIA